MDTVRYEIRPVTADRWDELAAFFGPSGAYSNCWCVWWRVKSKDFSAGCQDGGTGNRELLERITAEGRIPGLLAYRDGTAGPAPVGWVSVAPRAEFERLRRSPNLRPAPDDNFDDPAVWSVSCFWIPRGNRGNGIGRALLAGAVDHAFAQGAAVIEGYPVDTGEERAQASSIYTGTVSMFAKAGFQETLRRSGPRPVMRLER